MTNIFQSTLYLFQIEEDTVFLYPDMRTALVGKFDEGIMIEARSAKVIAERCNDGIKEIKLSEVRADAPSFKYSAPTPTYMGDQLTKMDPYEKQFAYIGNSDWGDDAVFAKKDIKRNEIVVYFSGIIISPSDDGYNGYGNETAYDW